MKPRAPSRAKLHLLLALLLFALTLNLISIPRSQNVCTALKAAHKQLLRTIHNLPRNVTASDIASCRSYHDELRRSSTDFLSISSLSQARPCRSLRPRRAKLEFSVFHSQLDATLIYLLAITGARKKVLVSLDSASGLGHLTGAVQGVLHGWRVIVVCKKWSGYEATRKFYERTSARVSVIDASSVITKMSQAGNHANPIDASVAREGVAGAIDVLAVFPEHGDEISILEHIRGSTLRPRLLAMSFEAYWGSAARLRTGEGVADSDGREHLFVGASLPALMKLAKRVQYRLVWCTISSPIALFVDEQAGVASGLLQDMRPEECFGSSTAWRRDAEAMWDAAQEHDWKTVT